jgi:hypothetical protein
MYYGIVLGCLMASMLAIASKVRGFNLGRGDGLLRVIKTGSKRSFRVEVKLLALSSPRRKILRHVENPFDV